VLTLLDAPSPNVLTVSLLLLGPLWNGFLAVSRAMEARSVPPVTPFVENR